MSFNTFTQQSNNGGTRARRVGSETETTHKPFTLTNLSAEGHFEFLFPEEVTTEDAANWEAQETTGRKPLHFANEERTILTPGELMLDGFASGESLVPHLDKLKSLTRRGLTPAGERARTPPILLAQWIGEHMMCVLRKVTIKRTAYVGGKLLRAFVTLDLLEIQEEARPSAKQGAERDSSQGFYYDPVTGKIQLRNSPLIVPASGSSRQTRTTGVPFIDAEDDGNQQPRAPGDIQRPRRSFYDPV